LRRAALVLTDAQWAVLEPLVEACRPAAKVPPRNLRRTVLAIVWRRANGAKWRALPEEFGPWWVGGTAPDRRRPSEAAPQTRWSRLGVWERLLAMAQARGVELGMGWRHASSPRRHLDPRAPKGGGRDQNGAAPAQRGAVQAPGRSR